MWWNTVKPLYNGYLLLADTFFRNGLVSYKILIIKPLCSGQLSADTSLQRTLFMSQLKVAIQKNLFQRTVQNYNDNRDTKEIFIIPFSKSKRVYSLRIKHYITDTRLVQTVSHI